MIQRQSYLTAINILLCVQILMSSKSMAETSWTLDQTSETVDFYTNTKTLKKIGNTASLWAMSNYKQPQILVDKIFNSSMHLEQYDCSKDRMRYISNVYYSGNFAEGVVIYTESQPSAWSYIPPGSYISKTMKQVCSN